MLFYSVIALFGALVGCLYLSDTEATVEDICLGYKLNKENITPGGWNLYGNIVVKNYCFVYEPGSGINKITKFCNCETTICKCLQQSLKDYKQESATKSDIGKKVYVVLHRPTRGNFPDAIWLERFEIVQVYDNGKLLVKKCQ